MVTYTDLDDLYKQYVDYCGDEKGVILTKEELHNVWWEQDFKFGKPLTPQEDSFLWTMVWKEEIAP